MVKYNGKILAENSFDAFQQKKKHLEATSPDLLKFLRDRNMKLTFFVTGRLYDASPKMIEDFAVAGHEIGWHGHNHVALTSEAILAEELKQSRIFIDRFKPKGFRAPWIIAKKTFLPILRQAGFQYDSSCFDSPGHFHDFDEMKILPVTGWRLFGGNDLYSEYDSRYAFALRTFPIGSNFAVSILRRQYSLILGRLTKQHKNGIFYLHNWQLFSWPERQLSLLRNKLRYVQQFPLLQTIKYLSERHTFFRLDHLLEANVSIGHCLTFDIE